MKRFTFRLQRVLEVKEGLEQGEKVALGQAQTVLLHQQQLLDGLVQTRQQSRLAARGAGPVLLSAPLLRLHDNYRQRLEREIEAQARQVLQAEAVVAERRTRLVEARRQRRVFELLREKALAAYRKETGRRQQLLLDEVGERMTGRQRAATYAAREQQEGGDAGNQ